MRRKDLLKFISMFLCSILLVQSLPIISKNQASAKDNEVTDYLTSFEEGDPKLSWNNMVETDSQGNKKVSGVIGEVPYDTIQGDITAEVKNIKASANNPPNEIEANLIDRNVQTKWLAFENTATIELTFAEPQKVIKYALTSANDSPGRDPKNWTLLGSKDGESWTELDIRENQVFEERYQRKIYEFSNDGTYTHYKFNVKNSGDQLTQLAEIAFSNGVDAPPPPPSDMKTYIGDGPTSSYTGKTGAGWTGMHALTYEGRHISEGRGFSYNKVLDVNIDVTSKTELSYFIHPQFMDKEELDYSSTFVSLDLAFTDGTYLSELGVKDQHGVKVDPQSQGKSKKMYSNQWNYIASNIGKVAKGKTIDRILIAYDNEKGPGVFKGSVDDIRIKNVTEKEAIESPADYVNILRGTNSNSTFSRGNNFPAVSVPHGFNFWTPVTNAGSTSWLYTYQQSNNSKNLPQLQAFSLSHETSPWMGDRQTFQVMPAAGDKPSANRQRRALAFKHENEIAKPYYYSVLFENGIRTEMAPANRAAMFKFTFTNENSSIIFDNVNNNGGLTLNTDDQSIAGYSDVKSGLSTGATRMFIYAVFDKPITGSGKLTGEGRDNVAGYYSFNTKGTDKTVTMKIATSLISVEQAKKNLEQDIKPNNTFEDIKNHAKQLWNEKLSIIEVEGASKDHLVTLYSNMYRLFLYPNIGYENTGTENNPVYQYASPFSKETGPNTVEKTGAKIVDGKPYINNGFWDTYRTTWPAYSLLTPRHAGEMIDGFVQQYRDGGWISRWSSPGYANLMVGTSSDVAFADAYLKGITNFDLEAFYQSAVKNASVASKDASVGRKGLATSIFDGYTSTSTGEGMSWAMDGYINDFGIANIAKSLMDQKGEKDPNYEAYKTDYQYYLNRAQNYVNMFNKEAAFFMGRESSGAWRTKAGKFNPEEWGGDYTETNAWNMAFHVPQDGQGLANLYGGREALGQKLNKFFTTPETALHPGHYGGIIHEMREARDVRMGMYGHSNQPSHHILYMYNYAGQPWKAQEKIREALSRLYIGSEIGQGYAGDEDNGEMSAWYIFSAAGFYPLQMGLPEYAIGAPFFEKMTIHLENGKDLVIKAPGVSDENKYVQSLNVNGKPYNKVIISHETIAEGATLEFKMGPKPSEWGTGQDALPTSITDSSTDGTSLEADQLKDLTDNQSGESTHSDKAVAGKLFDNSSDTHITLNGHTPWIQYHFAEGTEPAEMYTITSGQSESQDPKSWTLIGSKDGKDWFVLDKRMNENFKWRAYTRPFKIQDPGHYSYYRLIVEENQGGNSTSLAEIELLGYRDMSGDYKEVGQILHDFEEAGKIHGNLKEKLDTKVEQSITQFNLGHYKQAAKKLEDLLMDISKAKKGEISSEAEKKIMADVHMLMDLLSKRSDVADSSKKKYDGEIPQVPVFNLTDLNIAPIEPGEDATITVKVSNIGTQSGTQKLDFYFDDQLVGSQSVDVEPGQSQTVTFTVEKVELGIHKIQVNDLTGSLRALYGNQPVLSLSFNEQSGTIAKDSSPYGYNGTLVGGSSFVNGKFGNALSLKGGWVEVPTNSLLNGGEEMTIAAWVNLESPEKDQKLIGKTNIGDGYVIGISSGLYPELWTENGSRYSFNQGSIPANEWTHIAMTWKKDGRIIGYINGKEVVNISGGSSSIKPNERPLIIGGAPWDPSALQTKGLVDEVKIYKQSLSADEVYKLFSVNSIN